MVTDSTGSVTSNAATLTVTAAPVAPSISRNPPARPSPRDKRQPSASPRPARLRSNVSMEEERRSHRRRDFGVLHDAGDGRCRQRRAFTVTVTNSVSSVTSNAATLTVNVPPAITAQPANKSVTAGQTATFSVTATGTGTLTYQWFKNGVGISGGNFRVLHHSGNRGFR